MGVGRRLVVLFVLWSGAVCAGTEQEVKAKFLDFVAAQNAHDLKKVAEILADSPEAFWVARGAPTLGRKPILQDFREELCRSLGHRARPRQTEGDGDIR